VNTPPYVKLPGEWSRVGVWCNGILRCSRGDCPLYSTNASSIQTRRGPRLCMHHDGLGLHIGGATVLCVPWYRELQRFCASLLDAAKVARDR